MLYHKLRFRVTDCSTVNEQVNKRQFGFMLVFHSKSSHRICHFWQINGNFEFVQILSVKINTNTVDQLVPEYKY